ncbi:MAG: gluconokinase [Acidobacteriaceae bacterium]
MVVVLMGVTGTGKTTVGEAMAERTGWLFADADDFHSAASRAKMHAGIPLTDEDREPWLRSLHDQIETWAHKGVNGILACSALKESYRTKVTEGVLPGSVRFVFLTGPASVIRERMEVRHGHYMPESLLPSQLATLKPPHDAIEIPITQTVAAMVDQIPSALAKEGYAGVSKRKRQ